MDNSVGNEGIEENIPSSIPSSTSVGDAVGVTLDQIKSETADHDSSAQVKQENLENSDSVSNSQFNESDNDQNQNETQPEPEIKGIYMSIY